MFRRLSFKDITAAKELPVRLVTEKEFIAAFVAAGVSRKDAKMQLNIAISLGSEVVVGNERLELKVKRQRGKK